MRTLVLALGLALAAGPAFAQTIQPAEARAHAGQTVTVEGLVNAVHHAASGRATFIDFGGRYPDNTFSAVIFARAAGKFPDLDSLNGKTVDVTGQVRLYRGIAEIVLNDPAQLRTK